jgi:hypothetical protein
MQLVGAAKRFDFVEARTNMRGGHAKSFLIFVEI